MTNAENSDSSVGDQLARLAALIDAAMASESHYAMALAVREAVGLGLADDVQETSTDITKAVVWAFDYRTEIDSNNARRVRIVPRSDFGGRSEPPMVKDVPEQIKSMWRQLLGVVTAPAGRARLAHLLFEIGGPERLQDGGMAVDACIASAAHWGRDLDRVEDLRIGACLAYAIRDDVRQDRCFDALLDVSEAELDSESARAGIVLYPISHVMSFPRCPDRVDGLIERAAIELGDVDVRDQALQHAFQRCADDDCKQSIWRRRVEAFAAAAEEEQEPIVRLSLRRKGLEIAERSSIPDLRRHAAAQLEQARGEDLGLVRFGASSVLYTEEFDRVRDSFISTESWKAALVRFAYAGPLSGDVTQNRSFVETMRTENALSALFPVELLGPDNMPILRAISPEERFEYDLVRLEAQYTSMLSRPLVDALHEVVVRFGLPSSAELTAFLATWPGMSAPALHTVVRALHRFWSGDSEGATYTLVPRIEMLVRTLILGTARGMYKLQTTHAPGQYPGLGAMLAILPEEFEIDESRLRFLQLTLTEAAGFNTRNTLSHGINDWWDPGAAAIAIHNALFIATLRPAAEEDSSGSNGNESSEPGDVGED